MNISDLQKRVLVEKPAIPLLLDEFPNAAAAYSLRLLSSSYTGNCIEVRRSSDNALQNIGFVDGVLDTGSLLSFVGAGDGFVRTWYDQSGNNINAIQTNTVRQPVIVNNGSVTLFNNLPCVLFNSSFNQHLFRNSIFNQVGYGSIFSVHRKDTLTPEQMVLSEGVENTGVVRIRVGYSQIVNRGISIGGRRIASDAQQNINNQLVFSSNEFLTTTFFKWQNAILESYIDGNLNGVINPFQTSGLTNVSNFNFSIGSNPINTQNFFSGNIKEIVIYTTDQSTNRTNIEFNINDYYNIF
jgi:hypothetical protein